MQLNVLNYYYNLQVYKYFYFIRTVLSYTNELTFFLIPTSFNEYSNVQIYTLRLKIEKDYNIKKQYIICNNKKGFCK